MCVHLGSSGPSAVRRRIGATVRGVDIRIQATLNLDRTPIRIHGVYVRYLHEFVREVVLVDDVPGAERALPVVEGDARGGRTGGDRIALIEPGRLRTPHGVPSGSDPDPGFRAICLNREPGNFTRASRSGHWLDYIGAMLN